ncbi:hypothetical protein AB0E66_28130 [Streptomyces sp. NPDC033753]|uniref:hypothetical protein n=1 Tax=Streptomyces sp. NPDC033753 TaxID=3155128 RepID=UPI00341117FC
MESGVIAALIATGGALIGVIVGWVGPIIAARTQARATHAQADAALASAEHVAAEQHRTVMEQQARQARRDVYSRFQEGIHAFEEAVRDSWQEGELQRANRLAEVAFAQVVVEGPDEVEQAAKEVRQAMGALMYAHNITTQTTQDLARLHEGDPAWDDRQRTLAGSLISALEAMETAYRAVSWVAGYDGSGRGWFRWRYEVATGNTRANYTGRQLRAEWERAGRSLPPDDVASPYDIALTRAVNAIRDAYREGLFSYSAELLDRSGTLEQGARSQYMEAESRFNRAKDRFRLAARRVLHNLPDL